MKTHGDFICDLEEADKLDAIKEILGTYTEYLGGKYFIYAAMTQIPISIPDVVAITNYPDAWQERYTTNNYINVDPTVEHCSKSILPFYWNDQGYEGVARAMMDEAANYGMASGVTIPHRAPNGLFSLTSFCSEVKDDREFYVHLKKEYASIYLFCAHMHEKASSLISINYSETNDGCDLTLRERECLMWAADGKSSADMAGILGVSERTAVFHLNNAIKKLGATNRQQAVAKAVATGAFRTIGKGKPMNIRFKPY